MKLKLASMISDAISCLFILLFMYAAVSKITAYEKFRIELGKSPILSSYSAFVAVFVPTAEIILCILLAYKKFQLQAFFASFVLMVMFSAYIIAILKFSKFIPCSCGGVLGSMTWPQHLIFNIAFVLLSVIGILIHPNKEKSLL